GEAADRAAHRLAARAGDDVDPVHHALALGRAAAGGADEAGGVALVGVHRRAALPGQAGDLVPRRAVAVHRQHAVAGVHDLLRAVGARLPELLLQVGHVAVGVAVTLRLAQAHAVDDRGVVERVGDDRVPFAQQRLEQAAVGVEAGG